MKIGDEIYVHGFVDEIRKDVVIIKNDGGYFGTVPSEIIDNAEPTTLDKIKAEIEQIKPYDYPCDKRTPERIRDMALDIIDKYAEQEPTIGQLFSCEEVEELRNKIWKQVEQEPCDDVVSRQAVQDTIEDWLMSDDFDKRDLVQRLHGRIAKLPSVRPQEPKWIPVSERLPDEKQEKYLCTFDDGSIGMDWYEHYKSKWRWHSKTHHGYGTNVVAWMPLPKPYEPQESEDKE